MMYLILAQVLTPPHVNRLRQHSRVVRVHMVSHGWSIWSFHFGGRGVLVDELGPDVPVLVEVVDRKVADLPSESQRHSTFADLSSKSQQ